MKRLNFGVLKGAILTVILAVNIYAKEIADKKLVVLDPAIVEMIYMLNAQDKIAAIATLKMSKIWPEEKTELLKSVGTYTKPNLEKIIELEPQLVITSFYSSKVDDDIKKFNIPTLSLKAHSVDMIYQNIKQVGEITGKNDEATKLIARIETKFKTLENSQLKGKKIIALFSSNNLMAFSSKTLPGDIFNKLGMINLADKLNASTPIVSSEFILANNPDFIVLINNTPNSSNKNFLKENPTLAKTNAAKNDKILTLSSSLLLRGTPRIEQAIKQIHQMLIR